jgi:hypothetical protein
VRSERSATSAAASSATARTPAAGRAHRGRRARAGLVDAAEQQQAAHGDQLRVQRIGAIVPRRERRRRRRQRARRSAQVAHRQRHLGLGDDAARARELLVRAESARRPLDQLARAAMLAELRHRDAAQRQRRRVLAQADALERAQRVAGRQGARGGGDEGIHRRRSVDDALGLEQQRRRNRQAQEGRGSCG